MKLILTTLISIFIATTAFSQFGIKGGFALGEPVNDNNTKNMHLGFDLGVTYDITESIRVELLLESMYRKENFGFFGNYVSRIMPITVGADYKFLTGRIQPFAGFNLGLMNLSSKLGGNSNNGNTYFGLHPKAGIDIEITENILIDVTLKYHVAFNGSNLNNNKSTQIFGANIGLIYVFN